MELGQVLLHEPTLPNKTNLGFEGLDDIKISFKYFQTFKKPKLELV